MVTIYSKSNIDKDSVPDESNLRQYILQYSLIRRVPINETRLHFEVYNDFYTYSVKVKANLYDLSPRNYAIVYRAMHKLQSFHEHAKYHLVKFEFDIHQ